jgi:hypothetical protein
MRPSRIVLCLLLGFLLYPAIRLCSAATLTCGTSDVACLIAAITAANRTPEPDTIRLAAGTYLLTTVDNITNGANGLPSVTSPITLQGVGADQSIIARPPSAPTFRLLHVAPTGALTVQGLTMTTGRMGSTGVGGGIWNEGILVLTASKLVDNRADAGGGMANLGGQVTIERSELAGNVAGHFGGGLATSRGTVTIRDSTFAENGADGGGALYNENSTVIIMNSTIVDNGNFVSGSGGIVATSGTLQATNTTIARNYVANGIGASSGAMSVSGGTVSLTNCTVVQNTAPGGGSAGGIVQAGGSVTMDNTIVATNTGVHGNDCAGVITSLGHNLIGNPSGCTIALQPSDVTGDPGLDAYADDGQPGHGHYPLLATSRAVDAGNPFTCPLTDQLGRPRSGPCDLGAVEFQPVLPPALTLTLNQSRFMAGETTRVALHVQQPGPTFTGDFYFGALLPDGQTALFISNEGWIQARLDNPRAFRPLATHAVLAQGLDLTFDPFFAYTFHGEEASGIYSFFAVFTPPDAFDDDRVDAGDLLALEVKSFRFSPSGLVAQLPAKVQVIRDRHMNQ